MAKETDYKKLNQQLEEVLMALEAGDLDVDEAIKQHQKGMELVQELEKHLKSAENKVKKVQNLRTEK